MTARNGTLVVGGGFGGASVARLLGKEGATVVNPSAAMLYTPLLPEVAGGGIEPRHAVIPLRLMCPHAEFVRGSAVALDEGRHVLTVATQIGVVEIRYQRLVIALGATARMLPVPGLAERALPLKTVGDAIRLRNHVLERIERAAADPLRAQRQLTFVVAGAGYAGVEALAEIRQLVHDTVRHVAQLREIVPRFVLIDAGPAILGEVPGRLAEHAARRLERDGVEMRTSTTISAVDGAWVKLSDGTRIAAETLVWTAGVVPNALVTQLGLPLDSRRRIQVDETLRVVGRRDVWALGDCAAVPNQATPERTDPPTCQHALRQARHVVRALRGRSAPYRYRSIGQGATLGRLKGVALVAGVTVRGALGSVVVRCYHVSQVPQFSRAVRIAADSLLSLVLRRECAELQLDDASPTFPNAHVPGPSDQVAIVTPAQSA
jgi:NADH dehydrogenase